MMEGKNNITKRKQKPGKKSVLDDYIDEIKMYLEMDVGIASIWKILSNKNLKNKNITYNGFYKYCKRRGL
ncbi:hypothetical protein [Sulfurospirillum sp. 1612]|uniref:hypothetical protein n=1 Tax=Sulfurospirillum sp. 1612 TaxID=3094835 RepID=UPI002F9283B3